MALKRMTPIALSLGSVKYFRSNRCFNSSKLRQFNQGKIHTEELVTFDCGLMDMEEVAKPEFGLFQKDEQILAVILRPEIDVNYTLEHAGIFTFCGYDLVKASTCISAITNCGAEFESIPYEKLNQYGLLSSYREAVLTQLALYEEAPDEPHAYCEIVEIWRLLP